MKRIILVMADGDKAQPATIEIVKGAGIPQFLADENFEAKYAIFYRNQAQSLADALRFSLPGGTLDALTCILMQRRASLFRVPLYEEVGT